MDYHGSSADFMQPAHVGDRGDFWERSGMDFDGRGYYSDPLRSVFTATVIRAEPSGEGTTRVWLDKTFFYPLSGGQPEDRGTIGGHEVVSVTEDGGSVCHLVKGEFEKGQSVEGNIDMDRRRYHMQQHSGQHLLSRVLLEMGRFSTVGFHLGERTSTVDVDAPEASEAFLEKVELLVNSLIAANVPISDRVVGRDEYAKLGRKGSLNGTRLRSRLPEDADVIRIVEIEGIDSSTCCGTHCRSTGEIGLMKILGTENVKAGTRIEFVCGLRAVEDYAEKHRLISSAAKRFSADWRDLGMLMERLAGENRALKKENAKLRSEASTYMAVKISEPTASIGGHLVVKRMIEDVDASSLRGLASGIRDLGGRIVLLGIRSDPPALVFACSEGIDLDMGKLLRRVCGLMGARGGGARDFAQGGGGDGSKLGIVLDEAERIAREMLGS